MGTEKRGQIQESLSELFGGRCGPWSRGLSSPQTHLFTLRIGMGLYPAGGNLLKDFLPEQQASSQDGGYQEGTVCGWPLTQDLSS